MMSATIDWGRRETVAAKQAKQAEVEYQAWKLSREQAVAAITVTVDGMVFDGNEESQNRMLRPLAVAKAEDETMEWTLNDNTIAVVTVAQLRRALYLAGTRQTELWSEGRPDILAA